MNMACIISGPMGPEPDAMKVARPVLLNRGIMYFPLIYVPFSFTLGAFIPLKERVVSFTLK
ncbi:MAG: hypothetical protein ACTSU9_10790, partial [Promethearchaeota archaeon]